jgi:hypothetical protein
MSHLSTIIFRFRRRLEEVYNNDEQRASKDPLWLQSIANIKEYMDCWHDMTQEEIIEGNIIYQLYKNYLKGTIYERI